MCRLQSSEAQSMLPVCGEMTCSNHMPKCTHVGVYGDGETEPDKSGATEDLRVSSQALLTAKTPIHPYYPTSSIITPRYLEPDPYIDPRLLAAPSAGYTVEPTKSGTSAYVSASELSYPFSEVPFVGIGDWSTSIDWLPSSSTNACCSLLSTFDAGMANPGNRTYAETAATSLDSPGRHQWPTKPSSGYLAEPVCLRPP